MSTNEDTFGAGIALDQSMDLVVDNTGDIAATYGIEELEKDLAFRSKINLGEEIGRRLTKTQEKLLAVKSSRIVQNDPRIESVERADVTSNSLGDEMEIDMTVVADDGATYDFVFPVIG